MQGVVLNRFFCEFWIGFAQKLVVNSYAVVGQCLAVAIIDTFADIQKFLIILHRLSVFFDVIVEHTNRIIGATLVSNFSCPATSKGQHFVIFEPAQDGDIS